MMDLILKLLLRFRTIKLIPLIDILQDLRGNTETFKSCQTISLRETNEASTSSGKSVEQNGEVDVTSKAIQVCRHALFLL